MWKVYLSMKEYALALEHSRDQVQKDEVYSAQVCPNNCCDRVHPGIGSLYVMQAWGRPCCVNPLYVMYAWGRHAAICL